MRQTIDLNGAWQFGNVPRRPFDAPLVDDRPGGRMAGGYRPWGRPRRPAGAGAHPRAFLWDQPPRQSVGRSLRLWYRRPLPFLALRPGQRAFLIFDGIDYLSAIFVDGHELARHAGMFSRQVVEITTALAAMSAELLVPGPEAQVAVRIWDRARSPAALPCRSGCGRGWADRLDRPALSRPDCHA